MVLHESSTGQSTTSLCDAIIAEMISDPLPWLDLCVKAAEHHGHKDLRIRMSRFHSSGLLQTNSGSITLGRLNINSRLGMEGISQGSFHSLISPIVQNDIQRDWVNSRIMTTQSNTIPVSLPAVLMTQSNTTNSMKNSDELSDEESKRVCSR